MSVALAGVALVTTNRVGSGMCSLRSASILSLPHWSMWIFVEKDKYLHSVCSEKTLTWFSKKIFCIYSPAKFCPPPSPSQCGGRPSGGEPEPKSCTLKPQKPQGFVITDALRSWRFNKAHCRNRIFLISALQSCWRLKHLTVGSSWSLHLIPKATVTLAIYFIICLLAWFHR